MLSISQSNFVDRKSERSLFSHSQTYIGLYVTFEDSIKLTFTEMDMPPKIEVCLRIAQKIRLFHMVEN